MATLREKHVVILSGICGFLSLVILVSLATVWTYWSDTLNSCVETNCGCIFYGHLRGATFVGGHPMWCRTITYSTLIFTILGFIVAGYFFFKLRDERDTSRKIPSRVSQSYEEDVPHHNRRKRYSVSFAIMCGVIAFAAFVYACVLTEGYMSTCKDYKVVVARTLKASGDMSDLITDRLSCGATFDFMDYMQQSDSITRFPYSPQYYRHRTFRIYTGSLLIVSIIFSWIIVAIWIMLTVFAGFCK